MLAAQANNPFPYVLISPTFCSTPISSACQESDRSAYPAGLRAW
jgi:hypothetical protein